jgi:hypothetical protein
MDISRKIPLVLIPHLAHCSIGRGLVKLQLFNFIPGDICWSLECVDNQYFAWPCRIVCINTDCNDDGINDKPATNIAKRNPRLIPNHTLVCHSMALYCRVKNEKIVYKVAFLPFENNAMRMLDYHFKELFDRVDLVPFAFISVKSFDSILFKNCALIQALAIASSWAVPDGDNIVRFRLGAEIISIGCIVCLVDQPYEYFAIDTIVKTKSSVAVEGHVYIPNSSFTRWEFGPRLVLDKRYILRRFYLSYRVLEPPMPILERYSWEGFTIPKKRFVRFS